MSIPEHATLGSRFVVTKHARERLAERLGIHERKIPKLLYKAWKSTEQPSPRQNRLQYYSEYKGVEPRITKSLMGHVFIFVEQNNKIILLTFV